LFVTFSVKTSAGPASRLPVALQERLWVRSSVADEVPERRRGSDCADDGCDHARDRHGARVYGQDGMALVAEAPVA
jgi:hypothetical protein